MVRTSRHKKVKLMYLAVVVLITKGIVYVSILMSFLRPHELAWWQFSGQAGTIFIGELVFSFIIISIALKLKSSFAVKNIRTLAIVLLSSDIVILLIALLIGKGW